MLNKNFYKNTIFIFIFLGFIVACPGKNSYAKGYRRNPVKLKQMIINSYLKEIPLKFKKYFHFSRFRFTGPLKNVFRYSIKPITYNPGFAGYHTAIIKLTDKNKGKLHGIAYAAFKVRIYAPVAVAAQTIGKFQILKANDVEIDYKNIPDIYSGYYLNKKGIIGEEAKFVIIQNSILSKINTERKRIINFGNRVYIVYKSSGLNLKTRGMALQAGPYNSTIRVKNIESGVVVDGIVKSNKIVIVR